MKTKPGARRAVSHPDGAAQREKAALRAGLQAARLALPAEERRRADAARTSLVLALLRDWRTEKASQAGISASFTGFDGCAGSAEGAFSADGTGPHPVVALYLSRLPEPSSLTLAAELHRANWRLLVPAPGPSSAPWRDPAWAWYDEPLVVGPRGIPLAPGPALPPETLAEAGVIILPGLAGARDGGRLGYGGGWYDKALWHASPTAERWLLLGEDEVFDHLPEEAHDIGVSRLVTPAGVIVCLRPGGGPV